MMSDGSAYGRFQRALRSRNSTLAIAAATELATLDLADAFKLCLVLRQEPRRYARAAARWHARYCLEVPGVDLRESQLVLSALASLVGCHHAAAAGALERIFAGRGLGELTSALQRLG